MSTELPLGIPDDVWDGLPERAKDWIHGFDKGLAARNSDPDRNPVPSRVDLTSYPGVAGFQWAEAGLALNYTDLVAWHADEAKSLVDMAKEFEVAGVSVWDKLTEEQQRLLGQISKDPDKSAKIREATKGFLEKSGSAEGVVAAKATTVGNVSWRLPIDCSVMNAARVLDVTVDEVQVNGETRVKIKPIGY